MDEEEVQDCARYAATMANVHPKWRFYEQVFLLAVGPGLRASEITSLRICDVRLELPNPYVWVERGKGKVSASTPIPWAWAVARMGVFLKWRQDEYGASEPCDTWYQRPYAGGPSAPGAIWDQFKACLAPLPFDRQKELHPHSGRHTAATSLLNAGHTLPTVSKFLRHASLSSTLPYLHAQKITTDLYGMSAETDKQITAAWDGDRKVRNIREELEDLAIDTPAGSYMERRVKVAKEKLWRRQGLGGTRSDQVQECYAILNKKPSLYGDYVNDREWREVVIWRWMSWEHFRKELEYHRGERRSPVTTESIPDRNSAGRSTFVARPS